MNVSSCVTLRDVCVMIVVHSALDGERDAVAAAEAQRRDAALQVALLQRVEQRRQHAAPLEPIAWPSATAPPLTLTLRRIDAELVEHRDRLHGERFVQLEQIDVLQLPADLLGDAAHGFDRRHQHELRRQAARRLADDARQRREAERLARARRPSRPAPTRRRSRRARCRRSPCRPS